MTGETTDNRSQDADPLFLIAIAGLLGMVISGAGLSVLAINFLITNYGKALTLGTVFTLSVFMFIGSWAFARWAR